MKVALEVSQDHELRINIRKPDKESQLEEYPLFHNTVLFRKVQKGERGKSVYHRGYLHGKAPPGHEGDPSVPYTERDIDLIAERLYKRGEKMWKKGFMNFIMLTTMRRENALRPGEVLPTLDPAQLVAKYDIIGNMVDVEFPIPDNGAEVKHLCVRVGRMPQQVWYRVNISKVRQLARDEGRPIVGERNSEPADPELADPKFVEPELVETEPSDPELEEPEAGERMDPPNDRSGDGATRPPEIVPPSMASYPLKGNLVSPIGPTSPVKEPDTPDRNSREFPQTDTPHLCADHLNADFTPYPTTNNDYDDHPGRCKAMNARSKQCDETSLVCRDHENANPRMHPTTNDDYDSSPGRCKATTRDGTQCDVTFHLCPDHQIPNVRVYPNYDYDDNPGRCKAMNADGKQCDRKDACLAHLCGHHPLAEFGWYPITNDDYDGGPRRCKAMTQDGNQCKKGRKLQDRVAGAARGVVRSALPGRTPLCGIHLKASNITLYPSTNDDYDDDPGTCKAMFQSGPNKGKQCSKPRKN